MCIHCKYFPDELQEIEKLQTNLIETMGTKSEDERLQNEVNSLETENETLKSRLEKAKEEFAKMKDDVTKFEFLQQFLTTRDLIIHK